MPARLRRGRILLVMRTDVKRFLLNDNWDAGAPMSFRRNLVGYAYRCKKIPSE